MAKFKGCINQDCSARKNKIKYKETEHYCSKCGQELHFVCPKCYKVLPDSNSKYCIRCEEDEKCKKEKIAKTAGLVGGVAVAICSTVPIVKRFIKK